MIIRYKYDEHYSFNKEELKLEQININLLKQNIQ